MKQFYSLTALAVFFTIPAFAQYTQNFEASNSLTTGCTSVVNAALTNTPGEVITGTSSLYCNPPVTGAGTRDYSTPYLNFTTTSITVSFNYKLNQALNGQALRTIQIGIQDPNGFTPLTTINMDNNNDPVVSTPFSQTFSVPTGAHRLVLKMGGSQGNGSVRIILDDLVVSAGAYYSVGGTCNAAPSIQNDFYSTPSLTSYAGGSVLANDSDPNGESFGVPVVTVPSPDGNVTMNDDGTFLFVANAGFTGTSTSFTYNVFDKGFEPLSGSAVVTINFGAAAPLPLKLLSFQGTLVSNKVQLSWAVNDNQTGNSFTIEKSTDGKRYTEVKKVMITGRIGSESYLYNENESLNGSAFYRIKLENKDYSRSYSRIIFLKSTDGRNDGITVLQNPIRSALSFSFTAEKSGPATVNLYNMMGVRMQSFQVLVQKGSNVIAQPVNDAVVPGSYILEVSNGTDRKTVKLTK